MVVPFVTSVFRRPHPTRHVRDLSTVNTTRSRGSVIASFLSLLICVLGIVCDQCFHCRLRFLCQIIVHIPVNTCFLGTMIHYKLCGHLLSGS